MKKVQINKLRTPVKSLNEVKFKNGAAYIEEMLQLDENNLLKSLQEYTGKVQTTLPDGDQVLLEYINGKLLKSTRTGVKNVVKDYSTNELGEKIVKITREGQNKTVNITALQNNVKSEQRKFKKLLDEYKELSYEEFKNRVSKIKYINKKQQKRISEIETEKIFVIFTQVNLKTE